MFKSRFMKASALSALAAAMLVTSLPVEAQDRERRNGWGQQAERGERPQRTERANRGGWGGGERREARAAARAEAQGQAAAPQVQQRRGDYGANRDGSYGAWSRRDDARGERQQRDWRQENRAERREDARETRRDFRQGYRAGQVADGRNDRDAYRQGYRQGQRVEQRDDRFEQRRAYARGYRAGDRSDDNRWGGRDYRRWDDRSWRNDSRYDWYRYRAANRAIYRPGRYYAPYRDYSYSRLRIGFRLGSLFYSNRYWINDPWQYRLPAAYGPYRWVRYYDDALLVDIYSGEVVDVIYDFFW